MTGHTRLIFAFLCLSILAVNSSPLTKDVKATNCVVCHPTVEGKINVHLVPHSHDDAGWLKTVDQYFFGTGIYNTYENAGVQYIISSVVQSLRNNPDRRFIQVETAFFWKWWQKQTDYVKQNVIELVNNGQLEFVNAAWSMNDEAASHYNSIIDQYTWGFRVLNDSIGECSKPRIGWQIDPFGHSREHASINAQLGFDGLVIGRLDYRDKNKRILNKDLDFLWRTSSNLDDSTLFTTMFPNFYISEDGYRFDVTFQDAPINDDPESPDYNLFEKVQNFANILSYYKNYYKTPNIMLPMGGDFTYQAAEVNYANIDRLIKGFEGHDTFNVIYSTPTCYLEAVNAYVNANAIELSEKTDDFFPYASDAHQYWTGYFTSRPASKRYERTGNNILQATKQLAAFSKALGKDVDDSLNSLRETMGVLQHHDSITGTEKQAVADDYARLLSIAIGKAEEPLGVVIGDLLKKSATAQVDLNLGSCLLSNVSICETSGKDRFLVTVYNPLSRPVDHYVRLPVDDENYIITGPDGEEDYDVLEPISTFQWITEEHISQKELVFAAKNLPPLGLKVYYVEKTNVAKNRFRPFIPVANVDLGTEETGFSVDEGGNLVSVTINGQSLPVTQQFLYYAGLNGDNNGDVNRASGAYIFRPAEEEARSLGGISSFKVAQGQIVDELIQVYSENKNRSVSQIVRVYKNAADSYIEFDWLVGDLQFQDDGNGKEVISRFTINQFENNGVFYTDSNGREQIRRELNKRGDYDYDASVEPIASNYYPVTSKIVIKDENQGIEVAVLNDRAQGGSVLQDGVIEIMVHRRLPHDDALGVNEALNEVQYNWGLFARGQHWLVFGSPTSTPAIERDFAQKKLLAPVVLLTDATTTALNTLQKVQALINFQYAGLTSALPENVKILTLEPWKDDTYLLRLEHTVEIGEDAALSLPVSINISEIFTEFSIGELQETTLGANQLLEDFKKKQKITWNNEENNIELKPIADPTAVTLSPMQIRTFIIKPISKV